MKMVKLSLPLNLVLAVALIYVTTRRRPAVIFEHSDPAVPAVRVSDLPPVQVPPRASAQTAVESKPFSWSQIESADYRVYVANLRGIGCPELTIRDILTADVHSAFGPRREALELKQKSQSGSGLAGRLTEQSVETALEELKDEEAQLIKELLDPHDSSSVIAAGPIAAARERWHRMHEKPVSVPLVLQKVDLESLELDENRAKFISELREAFVKEIGGYNQDPNDPEYRKRWQKAQAEGDDLLRAMIGNQAYQNYQLHASADSVDQASTNP